jgi:hypothetical protein
VIGKKIYYSKININHSKSRKDDNVKENVISKEGKNHTKD